MEMDLFWRHRKQSGEKYGSSQRQSDRALTDSLTVWLFTLLSDVFINILVVKNGIRLHVYVAETV